jgi:hypothetical protein
MTVTSWLRLTISLWLLRVAVKITGWLLMFAVLVAVWPITVVAILGYLAAWGRGWPAARLRRAAAATLALTALYAVSDVVRAGQAAALAPVRAWEHGWHRDALVVGRMFVLVCPVAVPAGLGLAAGLWAWRTYAISAGIGGRMASAPVAFDNRQWRRQVAAAAGRTAAPGLVPLLTRKKAIPIGGTIRAVGCPWQPIFALPATACNRHMVIIGATGSRKTNLMIRLWAGWYTAALDAWYAGRGDRPLLIVLDCKGGRDARRKADRTRRLLYGAGAGRVAVWSDEARVSVWDLPAPDLAVLLYQMIETGTGNAAYYADILHAVTVLAVTAPGGPPASAAAFLERLDESWLLAAWDDGRHPGEAAAWTSSSAARPTPGSRSPPPASPATAAWPTCSPKPKPPSPGSPPSSAKTSNDPPATPSTPSNSKRNSPAKASRSSPPTNPPQLRESMPRPCSSAGSSKASRNGTGCKSRKRPGKASRNTPSPGGTSAPPPTATSPSGSPTPPRPKPPRAGPKAG